MERRVSCVICGSSVDSYGNLLTNQYAYATYLPAKGKRYMCDKCRHRQERYSFGDREGELGLIGVPKKTPFTFGVEFETNFCTPNAKGYLQSIKFVPTLDVSIGDDEYKTNAYIGLSSFPKALKTIEKLVEEREIVLTSDEGTHCNVGYTDKLNSDTVHFVANHYLDLFSDLATIMYDNRQKTEDLFGRYFVDYAKPTMRRNNYIFFDPYEHTNFINLQHSSHVEFRICKFRNKTQYMSAMKCCRDILNTVVINFINYQDMEYDECFIEHKAKITSNKLVKVYQKYTKDL